MGLQVWDAVPGLTMSFDCLQRPHGVTDLFYLDRCKYTMTKFPGTYFLEHHWATHIAFLLLDSIPLHESTTVCLFVHQLQDIGIVSSLGEIIKKAAVNIFIQGLLPWGKSFVSPLLRLPHYLRSHYLGDLSSILLASNVWHVSSRAGSSFIFVLKFPLWRQGTNNK
jgi:hypothetical protein